MDPHLLFEFADETGKITPYQFSNPVQVLQTKSLEEVSAIFKKIEVAIADGFYVAGYVSYEAAPAFYSKYRVHAEATLPLVWFGIFRSPNKEQKVDTAEPYHVSNWTVSSSYEDYQAGIEKIKKAIEIGDTYQVNYTVRMQANFQGDDFAFYNQLARNQQANYSAYLNTGDYRILSASPELFFRVTGNQLTTKPMKGTAKRGRFIKEDEQIAAKLRDSEKEQAENVMIVDLLRNDIGKIAKPGSVKVPHLFEIESYPTVHQMTSTISAELQDNVTIYDLFQALFPCGSITGAPKMRTMDYIAELETSARDIYCGAIGFISPERKATFNVPIRTVIIDTEKQTATYGVGGGITWDSTTEGEYEELLTKAKLLTERKPTFRLLETMKLEDGRYPLLTYHLNRLRSSARYFGYNYDEDMIHKKLLSIQGRHFEGNYKVRLLVSADGTIEVESTEVETKLSEIICALALNPVDENDPFLFHKTTNRTVYVQHQKQANDAFSVLLWNQKQQITEFTTGNLVVEKDGKYYTPPVTCGLLAGTLRQSLLDEGEISEKIIYKNELESFDRIWFINGVRGWLPVKLI